MDHCPCWDCSSHERISHSQCQGRSLPSLLLQRIVQMTHRSVLSDNKLQVKMKKKWQCGREECSCIVIIQKKCKEGSRKRIDNSLQRLLLQDDRLVEQTAQLRDCLVFYPGCRSLGNRLIQWGNRHPLWQIVEYSTTKPLQNKSLANFAQRLNPSARNSELFVQIVPTWRMW